VIVIARALAALSAAPFLLGAAVAPASHENVVFSFRDSAIDEASALVVLPDGLFVTTNDSGDTGRVFTVDKQGRTVGVTHWEQSPRDVEALATAPGRDRVWVGDIGDNSASRPHIQVAEIPVGRGDRSVHPTVYTLVYPDGAHDAETLLCDPATGRLYVATKGWFGGTVYAAPAHLRAGVDNRLTAVGHVLPIATDGAFLPGGREIVVRGYFSAATYTWPGLDHIATFRLPSQPQGEGIGVAVDGTAYLSSEGLHSKVLRFRLPAKATPLPPTADTAASLAPDDHTDDHTEREWWPWVLGGVIVAGAIGVLVRSLRPR
jgi:hypothetical protein